jgi:hypothetical protein
LKWNGVAGGRHGGGVLPLPPSASPGIDLLEQAMTRCAPADMPVTHSFTPGLYIREIRIPAGTLLTSAIHRTEHPFVVSQGRIAVVSENEGRQIYEAPHTGITRPGTRRVLYAETDTIWTTFHATHLTDVAAICAEILEPVSNPLLAESFTPAFAHSHPALT